MRGPEARISVEGQKGDGVCDFSIRFMVLLHLHARSHAHTRTRMFARTPARSPARTHVFFCGGGSTFVEGRRGIGRIVGGRGEKVYYERRGESVSWVGEGKEECVRVNVCELQMQQRREEQESTRLCRRPFRFIASSFSQFVHVWWVMLMCG